MGAKEMMEAMCELDGVKHTRSKTTTRLAKGIPENNTNCSLLFNCTHHNACDDRKPKSFRLPTIENLGTAVTECGEKGLFAVKIDAMDCFRSIKLPRK